MLEEFIRALALMLIFESFALLSPKLFKQAIQVTLTIDDDKLRLSGVVLMIIGAVILYAVSAS